MINGYWFWQVKSLELDIDFHARCLLSKFNTFMIYWPEDENSTLYPDTSDAYHLQSNVDWRGGISCTTLLFRKAWMNIGATIWYLLLTLCWDLKRSIEPQQLLQDAQSYQLRQHSAWSLWMLMIWWSFLWPWKGKWTCNSLQKYQTFFCLNLRRGYCVLDQSQKSKAGKWYWRAKYCDSRRQSIKVWKLRWTLIRFSLPRLCGLGCVTHVVWDSRCWNSRILMWFKTHSPSNRIYLHMIYSKWRRGRRNKK